MAAKKGEGIRDKPFLPLYVQDFMTDEKLMECSAAATGVYIRIMCMMHKSEQYGKILLKQKDKQNANQIKNFACKVAKSLPYDLHTIEHAIAELVDEGVLIIDSDYLIQKRMVTDCELSLKRAKAGAEGGKKTQVFAKANNKANALANSKANSDIDNDSDNDSENELSVWGMGENGSVEFEWQDLAKKHAVKWEQFCMTTGKSMEVITQAANDYQLYLEEKNLLPVQFKQFTAGLSRRLNNGWHPVARQNNNQNGSSNHQPSKAEANIEGYKAWITG